MDQNILITSILNSASFTELLQQNPSRGEFATYIETLLPCTIVDSSNVDETLGFFAEEQQSRGQTVYRAIVEEDRVTNVINITDEFRQNITAQFGRAGIDYRMKSKEGYTTDKNTIIFYARE